MTEQSAWLVGELPPALHADLASQVELVSVTPKDFAVAPGSLGKSPLLIIGAGVSLTALSSTLSSIRSSQPAMLIYSANEAGSNGDDVYRENWADSHFVLPRDSRDFVLAVRRALTYSESHKPHQAEKYAKAIFYPAFAVIAIWWLAGILFQPPPYLLPSPDRVAKAFWSQANTFGRHLGVTALEALLGFALGNSLGMGLAILLHRYYRLRSLTLPVLISFQAIPIVALAPILIVWLGSGLASKVAMAAIICFFPMVVNAMQAFSTVDADFVELFNFYQSDYARRLAYLLIPSSINALIAALKISAGLAVVGAIVAELTGADEGLGYLLLNSSYRLETDIMFVAMLLSAVLGIVFYQAPGLLRFVTPRPWIRSI